MSRHAREDLVWDLIETELGRADAPAVAQVLDVGGGSGGLAVPLAREGCTVTVVDASADALATLHRRAAEAGVAGRIRGVQGDVDDLSGVVPEAGFDLVLCHSVLGVVDDPAAAVAALSAATRPGGALSIVVANRASVVLARAVRGELAQAAAALADADGRWGPGDALLHRFDAAGLGAMLQAAGCVVESVHGVGVFADLIASDDGGAPARLRALERAASDIPPYRDIAGRLHILARR